MHEFEHQVIVTRIRIAAPVFYLLTVLLFPVTLLGYLIWVGKTLLTGRGSGVSRTAQGPLSIRWYMHQLGTRPDEPSQRLLLLLQGVAPVGVHLPVVCGLGKSRPISSIYSEQCELRRMRIDGFKTKPKPESTNYW